ncbi:hypothetical protein BCR43DRAFT_444348 [Syncephalastrum racemosum]|uniref:PDZ domain-containing protein n=1 Tax=Syncephalastrum racemosum TaxID=13706 RepID=A0A1X2H4Y0_SYNRA|nr:hypothetical protein BCR43DRAFT_444348 [Syncephalastrum racemosum]
MTKTVDTVHAPQDPLSTLFAQENNTHRRSRARHQRSTEKSSSSNTTNDWQTTVEKCTKSIFSIKAARARAFDTEIPGSYTATGFVVDAKRGLVLSNRHVVSVAPTKYQAILSNNEEIELKPIYRDPIHDFGFLQYDPDHVRFMDIPGIELYPEGAVIGREIRVIGADAGEKMSILSGTLARLDRHAPNYGEGAYNDFNTFYLQAASGTSAGSSGSPVLDLSGRAIALNAGGASAAHVASSFYLPLHRVIHALRHIQQQLDLYGAIRSPPPRGTLQTDFEHRSYHELIQLGLDPALEKELRQNNRNSGLLVVHTILPGGPADCVLEPGDIVLGGDHGRIYGFDALADLLDGAVGRSIRLQLLRAGELTEATLDVQDLHSITPGRLLEFGGGIVHDLSYQIARSYGISLQEPGVYVAAAGYILGTAYCVRRSIVTGLNHQPVRHLDDFKRIAQTIPSGARVPIRFYSLDQPKKERIMIIHADHRWHAFREAIMDDASGVWHYREVAKPEQAEIPIKIRSGAQAAIKSFPANSLYDLENTLVAVDCNPPHVMDGMQNSHSYGTGFVVSLEPPFVVCDRDTVPVGIASIRLTFRRTLTIPAQIVFLHPHANFAVLSFDPQELIHAGMMEQPYAVLSDVEPSPGDKVHYVGLGGDNEAMVQEITLPSPSVLRTKECTPARYRAVNVEAYQLKGGSNQVPDGQGGLFCDRDWRVLAYWCTFGTESSRGVPITLLGGLPSIYIKPTLDLLMKNRGVSARQRPVVMGINVECRTMQQASARLLGVPPCWLDRLHQLVYVVGVTDVSSPSGEILRVGDIILEVNGQPITRLTDLARFYDEKVLHMMLLRDGHEMACDVPATAFDGQETTRLVGWQGLVIQDAHMGAREQIRTSVPEGVFVSSSLFGSPAQASLKPNIWIVQIDGQSTPDLDGFIQAIQARAAKGHDGYVRVKYVSCKGITSVASLKLDLHYWRTWQLFKRGNGNDTAWDLIQY